MFKNIINISYVKIRVTFVFVTLIIFMLFILLILPSEAARSDEYFGDTSAPDTSFFYSAEDLYRTARDFGSEGRAYYIRSRFTFDIVWPLAYGVFLWASIAYFGRGLKHTIIRYMILLPILAVILDYMENPGASLVMFMYPDRVPVLPSIVAFFTMSKWLTIGASFIVLVSLIICNIITLLQPKQFN